MTAVLAALASVPHRAHLLPKVLQSLRPQVDKLCIYLNGYTKVPKCVLDFTDAYILDPVLGGAERKLFNWSSSHGGIRGFSGIRLSCDDDLCVCPGYAATMCAAVAHWHGRAIITAHGRTYQGKPRDWHAIVPGSLGIIHNQVQTGAWVNHGGSGVMAWDTRQIRIPDKWPQRNLVDMQIAVWAQQNQIPIWLIPHKAKWLESLAYLDPKGIFKSSQVEGHRRRTELVRSLTWKLHTLEDPQPQTCNAGM
jgi:hypothetical protein